MRSVSVAILLGAAAGIAGCATTQQEASRLQLNSARIRATEQLTRVAKPNPQITVQTVTLLAGNGGSAIVVRLRSTAGQILTDLPISVGLSGRHGVRRYLNGSVQGDYFDSHIAAIAPGTSLTWVFTTHRKLAGRPFATVGDPAPGFSSARALPSIVVSRRAPAGKSPLELTVHNPTSVPQYGLQVFATVRGPGGYVAAGRAELAHLGTGSTQNVQITLLGRATTATPTLQATPTMFH